MLKWTARAFAMAAALQLGVASAQEADTEQGATLTPPSPTDTAEIDESVEEAEEPQAGAETETDRPAGERDIEAGVQDRESQSDAPEAGADLETDPANPQLQEPREPEEQRQQTEDQRRQDDLQRDEFQQDQFREDAPGARGEFRDEQQQGPIQREARFAPPSEEFRGSPQVEERIQAATAHLDIDDETRSRYRWHNNEWWFKTRSGDWKFYRNGSWQDFDPANYRPAAGAQFQQGQFQQGSFAPQSNYGYGESQMYAQPQQYGSSSGYYYRSQPYTTYNYGYSRPYRTYRPSWDNYYGNRYYGGYGYRGGYSPWNDRYYGYGPWGGYSVDGDVYRGGIIGSEIGGRIGGRTGAIIGGAIGAEAAD